MEESKIIEELKKLRTSFDNLSKVLLIQKSNETRQKSSAPFPYTSNEGTVFLEPPGKYGYCPKCLTERKMGFAKHHKEGTSQVCCSFCRHHEDRLTH